MSTARIAKQLNETKSLAPLTDVSQSPGSTQSSPHSSQDTHYSGDSFFDAGKSDDPFLPSLDDYKLDPKQLIYLEENAQSGSLGVVYQGFYRNQTVAVKRLELENTYYKNDAPTRFWTEIENNIAIQSIHPNTFVHFIGFIASPLSILFEYCARGSLFDLLDDHSIPLNLHLRLSFLKDVAAALVLLHQAGWVHADIKSSNVLITEDYRAKLGDFDLARPVTALPSSAGTKDFMAPEIEEVGVNQQTDIFSFGVLAWEVKERTTPSFSDETIREEIRCGKREPMSQEPKPLFNLISKLWAQRPEERPTARQALVTLENMISKLNP